MFIRTLRSALPILSALACMVPAVGFAQAAIKADDLPKPPPGGTVLVAAGDFSAYENGPVGQGSAEVVDVNGPGFDKALQVTVGKRGMPWDTALNHAIPVAFEKGDVLLMHTWLRAVKSRDESGQAFVALDVAQGHDPWDSPVGRTISSGAEWQEFYLRGVCEKDYPPGDLNLKLFCGTVEQTLQLGQISVVNYGSTVDVGSLPQTRSTYDGRNADAAWRAEADARIKELRTAPLSLEVLDRDGKPVSGAEVHVRMTRHQFAFGAAVFAHKLVNDERGNEIYRQRFLEMFSAGSFINALKWPAWIGDWGSTDFGEDVALRGLRWMREHDVEMRGHVLVWPSFRNLPKFLETAHEQGASPQRINELILSHIDSIGEATDGLLAEWDVMNEPRDNHEIMDLAGEQVMVDWFERARERMPSARLALNDYGLLTTMADGPALDGYEKTARYLLDHGAPLDVLGLQGHFGSTVPGPVRVKAVLDRFAELGLPIRITEFDVKSEDESLKADFGRDVLTMLFSHPSVIGVQTWGLGNMYDEAGHKTPMGEQWYDLIHKQWWTDETAKTDPDGKVETRGFLGRYTVSVRKGDASIDVAVELKKDATPTIVTLPAGSKPKEDAVN